VRPEALVSRGLNKVLLIGNLGRDPEMRYTPGGKPVTTFSLAAGRTYTTPEGERREVTEWFHVVAWRRLAEICSQHLHQGSRVYVEGRLQTRYWQDADGRRQQRVEIVAQEMIVLDGGARAAFGHERASSAGHGHDDDYSDEDNPYDDEE
jgi:single-strand DNA-binding protein